MPNYVGFPDIYDNNMNTHEHVEIEEMHEVNSEPNHQAEETFEVEERQVHLENFDMGEYDKMTKDRKHLDFRLREIKQMKNSIYSENKLRNDANFYTTFMLTVLASTIVAYIFIKT